MLRENQARAATATVTTGWFRLNFVQPTFKPMILVGRSRWLALLTGVYSLCYVGMADRSSLLTLYSKKHPFDMDDDQVGWFLSSLGLARAVAVFAVLPLLLRSIPLLWCARLGMLFAAVFTGCIGLARNTQSLYIMATLSGLDAVWDTSLRVLFSSAGSAIGAGDGEVLGVIGFLQVRHTLCASHSSIILLTLSSLGFPGISSTYLLSNYLCRNSHLVPTVFVLSDLCIDDGLFGIVHGYAAT